MKQNQIPTKQPWEYILPRHIGRFGPDIENPDKRSIWCQAFFYGGSTLRLWNEAAELKIALLSASALQEGQRVILIGKYATESRLAPALHSLLGQTGHMVVEEIGAQAVAAFSKIHSAPGKQLQWDFNYFASLPDRSLDRVILFGAACHIRNWKDCAQHIHRVLRDGGRVIIADAPLGGKDLFTAAHMEAHLEAFVTRILSGIGLKEEELPDIGPEDLMTTFKPFLRWSRVFSWQGLYLFYGQKGGKEEPPLSKFPMSTEAVQAFLIEKLSTTPWDFLAAPEIVALGSQVKDTNSQKNWGRAIFFAGNLEWMYANSRIITHVMYSNLVVRPGDKVLVIGEILEGLGFLPELRKRIGKAGEIAAFDMVDKSRTAHMQQWESGPGILIPEKHRWDYPFADRYPDNYFDVIWLPQGVHHARDWSDLAPRLLRTLKPGGQVMMLECRTCPPEFFTGIKISGLLKCVAEKIFWAMDDTFEEMPDYTATELAQFFGDSLTNSFSLEWKGWLLYWGCKK